MIGRLNHVAIVVPDLAAAARKYRDLLGANVHHPRDLPVFFHRLAIEVLSFKEGAKFAQRQASGYCLDVARHIVSDYLFKKDFQDMTSIGV